LVKLKRGNSPPSLRSVVTFEKIVDHSGNEISLVVLTSSREYLSMLERVNKLKNIYPIENLNINNDIIKF